MNFSLLKKKIRWTTERYTYLYTGVIPFWGHFSLMNYWRLRKDKNALLRQAKQSQYRFPITSLRPCYSDRTDDAGSLPLHYFFQDLFVAQRVFKNAPLHHVDIGSRIDGFVAHLASSRKTAFLLFHVYMRWNILVWVDMAIRSILMDLILGSKTLQLYWNQVESSIFQYQ